MIVSMGNLSVLAYANGFTLWHYRTAAETGAQVSAAGYFQPAADMLATGDIVIVNATDGVRMLCVTGGKTLMLAPLA